MAADSATDSSVRCYFSFRSPYSWLALHRLERALAGARVSVDYVPVFPPPKFANDPLNFPDKAAYFAEDVARIASAYGLPFVAPERFDCDWLRPHAAFLAALDAGRGPEFSAALYGARFCHGRDLGQDGVIAECAREVGLDGEAMVAAQGARELQERVMTGMLRAVADKLFGVPLFVYRGERFWGNDRIDWLLRSIHRQQGLPVPDLAAAPERPVVFEPVSDRPGAS